jgi:hypothetical protein
VPGDPGTTKNGRGLATAGGGAEAQRRSVAVGREVQQTLARPATGTISGTVGGFGRRGRGSRARKCLKELVGATGFEPATTGPPVRCATGLRYAPRSRAWIVARTPQRFKESAGPATR